VDRPLASRLVEQSSRAGLRLSADTAERLAAYLELLARWNRRINLTALPVDPPSDGAIHRLILEPLAAAPLVASTDRLTIDIGSGGGSPALPLKIAVPALRFVLVEARARKSAFLREAVRHLDLAHVSVETCRAETLAGSGALAAAADLVTMRAVRAAPALWSTIDALLSVNGRVFWFVDRASGAEPDARFVPIDVAGSPLGPMVLRRSAAVAD
jgi:16S rRNA (guanine527-N7)-methyltransferase